MTPILHLLNLLLCAGLIVVGVVLLVLFVIHMLGGPQQ